jgi:hypothetical protein
MATGDMQDGMLAYYQSQAAASDSTVEPRLEREPFDYREYLLKQQKTYPATLTASTLQALLTSSVRTPLG